MKTPRLALAFGCAMAATASGCGPTHHLSKDYGVSFHTAFSQQADRTAHPGRDYALDGREGVQIRLRAQEAATAEKSATIQAD
jgi:hypothetical protein